ncbi:M20/M25/M40 family metallo-hydrolase [Geodermatophilus ruber]|uniref:M20/M25/M40 family metallo-hydrolase n=1 Tax=Geodermatophilus ruber TaxID=504800 RepID=UPI001C433745|nr:M20/M25/M40 family metallo-hydrolase [Geodermatophilus ruber]
MHPLSRRRLAVPLLLALASPALLTTPAAAGTTPDTTAFLDAVTVDGITEHLLALQGIAEANDGNRASGSSGYDASAAYVAERLTAAGYRVSTQEFTFSAFREVEPASFARTAPTARSYGAEDFAVMEYSGSGEVTAAVTPVDLTLPPPAEPGSTSGCEAADFAGFPGGTVALVQRGTCDFATKAGNAQAAGAAAVVVFNEGQEGRTDVVAGTLGGPGITIPVLGASFAVGQELAAPESAVAIRTSTRVDEETTSNVIADSPTGRTDRTVVVGAHLDSVPEGPGINDNGSGAATILEIAEEMAELGIQPRNAVRFAFWGAEESGLLGAEHYVSQLTERQRKDIALNLNFDMLGSPNYARFVYDGDGSDTPDAGPNGSGNIERVFLDHFAARGLAAEPTAFDGRSDYGPFIAAGIPAGGLFSGAEGVKTEEQVARYGGEAGAPYDACYHTACDDITNINPTALDELGDAAAHATLVFAQTRSSVNGTARAGGSGGSAGHGLAR